jgi:hypothetical protein
MTMQERSSEEETEPQLPTTPQILFSPWRNRKEFSEQLESVTLEGLNTQKPGELLTWDWVSIFGDKISIVVENVPSDELIGPHAVVKMSLGDVTDGIEINTGGVTAFDKRKLFEEKPFVDVGDGRQITYFIEMCARALESGIPPDGIADSAINAYPRGNIRDRESYHENKLRDFSRQLSERHFL